jgi:pimeloyl-ACP methyl ester carboxylesterase
MSVYLGSGMVRIGIYAAGVALASFLHSMAALADSNESVVAVPTRPGVEQLILLVAPKGQPVASVILFPGGSGKIGLWKNDPGGYGNSFLVRTRKLFAGHGFVTAVVDVPSDRRTGSGLREFRDSRAHRTDIRAVVRFLRQRANLPVWLIGTSRGTISAAHLATNLAVDGVVLSATVTEASQRSRATVFDAPLGRIRPPVLIVHHRSDACRVTPYLNVTSLKSRFTATGIVEILAFEGGRPSESEPCRGLSPHGFFGIEDRVVGDVARWIKRASPE